MKIEIEYEASWRNSFLDGSNDEPLPKKGRKYIASSTNLKKSENYITREVSNNTVMGILNRLIGDQRKLYQARKEEAYYFDEIEKSVTFKDNIEVENSEIVYLRNMNNSEDQESFTGQIIANDKMFISDYSVEFWSVLSLNLDELISFILNNDKVIKSIDLNPIYIANRFKELETKPIENSNIMEQVLNVFKASFPEQEYINNKGKIAPIGLYCSALYLQYERLSKVYDMSIVLTKRGALSGISKKGFTKKGFMNRFTTGKMKKIFGNPYISVSYPDGGKITSKLTKANGTLEITLDISHDKAKELRKLIENAGVSSFYLGKKGLAYVTNIDTREEK